MNERKRLIVVGGGAAGFFCAVTAARLHPGVQVVIIEKTGKLLSKVKVSGGGRCNVTHACFDIPEMSRRYPRGGNFVKKTFHQFFTSDTVNWFAERGVELKEESDGRMFPVSDSSQTIVDCLLREANRFDIDIRMNRSVDEIIHRESGGFKLKLGGEELECDYLCIATGGYPKSAMFDWLKRTGHSIEPPVPSLFTFNLPGHSITALMGVVVDRARIRLSGSKLEQTGPILVTHWGLSGPAVLRLSAWAAVELASKNYEFDVMINWLPDFNEQSLGQRMSELRFELAARSVRSRNVFGLPQRLWEYLIDQSVTRSDVRWADLPAKEQNKLIRLICAFEVNCKGKTTFKEEFVTAGGIKTEEVNPSTLMSRLVPGLYFAGEVLNVDGITGGYNFQHAWTTGFIAGQLSGNMP